MQWQKIKDLFPLLAVLLVVLGIIRASFYYSGFGVNIMPYIDLSEATLLFANDLISIVLVLFSPFLFLLFLIVSTKEKNQWYHHFVDVIQSKHLAAFIVGFVVLISSLICYQLVQNYSYTSIVYPIGQVAAMAVFSLGISLTYLYRTKAELMQSNADKSVASNTAPKFFVTLILIFSFYYTLMSVGFEQGNIFEGHSRQVTCQLKDGQTVRTDSVLSFVGQTRGYLFFYHRTDSVAVVYPSQDIASLRIAKGKSW